MNTLPARNPNMDFETADLIVDRLSAVLQSESRIKSYLALEWIGSWSVPEVCRALYLIMAMHYREQFPASQTSKEFEEFAQLIEGSVVLVQSSFFPMADLADLDRSAQDSPEWRAADRVLAEKAVERCRLGVGTAEGFTDWLVSINHPGFDDYCTMVNDRIDRLKRT